MCRPTMLLLLPLMACEARISGAPADVGGGDVAVIDATPDAIDALASIDAPAVMPLGDWSMPIKLSPAATNGLGEDDATLSSNQLELFFSVGAADGSGSKKLYYTSRPSRTSDAWATPAPLAFNSTTSDETPRLSADDLTLYFASSRAGNGTLDIYSVTRAAVGSTDWTALAPRTEVNSTTLTEKWFMPCDADHYVLARGQPGGQTDLVEGTLSSSTAAAPIISLNSMQDEIGTFLSQDCLRIYFASGRNGGMQLYTALRASLTDPWPQPERFDDFSSIGGQQEDPWVSSDDRTFLFVSNASGTKDVYISTR